jgi:hypothetical protein
MDEQARESAFMSALVTEHFVLQSAASTTISEASARASLYVFSLSSALVAIGFAAQSPDVFRPFVATVLPALFVLGCFTVVRLVDTTVENSRFLRAIAQIRRYRTLSPAASTYFAPWQASDEEAAEALAMLGTRPRRTTVLLTMASMVATINSLSGPSALPAGCRGARHTGCASDPGGRRDGCGLCRRRVHLSTCRPSAAAAANLQRRASAHA